MPTTVELQNRLRDSAVVANIGRTPLYTLSRLPEAHGISPEVRISLKAEWVNPGGSVKDRPALFIVRDMIERDLLGTGRVLIDSTSGNTGIAYAMLGAALGFPVELVLPASASDERKRILAAYGATIVESDPYEGSDGAIRHCRRLLAATPDRYAFADQYNNPANPKAHEETTGPEIWNDTNGDVTHFVATLGTTGTMVGTGRYLRRRNPDIVLAALQPDDQFHAIEGLKHIPTAIRPGIYDESVPNRQLVTDTETAYDRAQELARLEGLFTGTSTGAAVEAALQLARELTERNETAHIVAIAPDNGNKYVSTGLWSTAPEGPTRKGN
jgi:cysteine synthase B